MTTTRMKALNNVQALVNLCTIRINVFCQWHRNRGGLELPLSLKWDHWYTQHGDQGARAPPSSCATCHIMNATMYIVCMMIDKVIGNKNYILIGNGKVTDTRPGISSPIPVCYRYNITIHNQDIFSTNSKECLGL